MDFMRILQSLEQALFEVIAWLVFYPRTMWLAIRRPLAAMAYADDELDDRGEERYGDTINPPLFLVLTMGLSTAISNTLGTAGEDLDGLLAKDENLLAFDILLFSLIPLMFALRLVKRKGLKLDRTTLRPPFYQQCYVAAPYCLLLGLSGDVASLPGDTATMIGVGLIGLVTAWFLRVQVQWFATQLPDGTLRCAGHAVRAWLAAAFWIVLFGVLVTEATAAP